MKQQERIGEGLLRYKVIKSDHVNNVLMRQRCGDRRKFGEIALALKYLDMSDLSNYLQTQDLQLWDDNESAILQAGIKSRNTAG